MPRRNTAKRIRQRGGSIPSDNVMKLVPKACPTGAPGFDNAPTITPEPAAARAPTTLKSISRIAAGGAKRRRSARAGETAQKLLAKRHALHQRAGALHSRMQALKAKGARLQKRKQELAGKQQLGGSKRRTRTAQVGGDATTPALTAACNDSHSFAAPYTYDSFGHWRGNGSGSGGGIPATTTEKLNNWFQGETTLFTPSESSHMNQDKAQMFTGAVDLKAASTSNDFTTATYSIPGSSSSQPDIKIPLFADRKAPPVRHNIPFARAGGARKRRTQRRK